MIKDQKAFADALASATQTRSSGDPDRLVDAGFGHLIADSTKAGLTEAQFRELVCVAVYVIGIDPAWKPGPWRSATLLELWAIDDLVGRSHAIIANNLHGHEDEAIADLIRSVAEEGCIGALVQARLQGPMPYVKWYPHWWRPVKRWPRVRYDAPTGIEQIGGWRS